MKENLLRLCLIFSGIVGVSAQNTDSLKQKKGLAGWTLQPIYRTITYGADLLLRINL